jgi:hypothetical protein
LVLWSDSAAESRIGDCASLGSFRFCNENDCVCAGNIIARFVAYRDTIWNGGIP